MAYFSQIRDSIERLKELSDTCMQSVITDFPQVIYELELIYESCTEFLQPQTFGDRHERYAMLQSLASVFAALQLMEIRMDKEAYGNAKNPDSFLQTQAEALSKATLEEFNRLKESKVAG